MVHGPRMRRRHVGTPLKEAGYTVVPMIADDRTSQSLHIWSLMVVLGWLSGWAVAWFGWVGLLPTVFTLVIGWQLTRRSRELARRKRIRQEAWTEALPAIVWSIGPDGVCDYTNSQSNDFSGMYRREDSHSVWLSVIHPEDRPRLLRAWEQAKLDCVSFDIDFRVRRSVDGHYRWHHAKVVPHFAAPEQSARWFCSAIDIHDLRHSENVFRLAAEAGEQLAGSLDLATTLRTVVELGVPHLADWGYAYLFDSNSHVETASTHTDPSRIAVVNQIAEWCRIGVNTPSNYVHMLNHLKPILMENVNKTSLETVNLFDETRSLLLELECRSLIAVPLVLQGKTMGVLTYATSHSERRLDQDDLKLATDLARRASIAVENSRLYREATESLALLDTLVNSAPVGFCYLDSELRVVRVNERLTEMSGRTASDFVDRHPEQILEPSVYAQIAPHLQRALAGEAVLSLEMSFPPGSDPDDLPIDTLSSYYPVYSPHDHILGVGITIVDITDRKRVERELANAKEAAETANRFKDRFLAVLSHELRTPLTPVLAAVELLLDSSEELVPVPRESLEMIRRNIGLEARLINDLLDVTRIGRGQIELDLEPLDVHTLIRQAVEICRSEIVEAGHTLTMTLEASSSIVQADPLRLLQAVWNLIKNAVKFTPKHGNIEIRTKNRDGLLILDVEDDGIGISPEFLSKIFDFFVQGSSQGLNNRYGLGLGLGISHWVVSAHGGTIEAISGGLGQGARFVVELQTITSPIHAGVHASVDRRVLQSQRLLVVDDHEDTREVIATALRRRGYEVDTACGVAEALDRGLSQEYDLLISDIALSDGSGLDLMERLKLERGLLGIALSGYCDDDDQLRSQEVGFVEFLLKPVDFGRLLQAIKRAVDSTQKA